MKTAIIGYGSVHGDDQAGWKVVEQLSRIKSLDSKIHCIQSDGNGLDWMQQLQGISNVIFIDAVKSGAQPGNLRQIPYEELAATSKNQNSAQSHRYPLFQSIELAINLKFLSVPFIIYGIEIENTVPLSKMTDSVTIGVKLLVDKIIFDYEYSST